MGYEEIKNKSPPRSAAVAAMEDFAAPPPSKTQDNPLLRRRNSISTSIAVVPTKLTLFPNHNSSSATTSTTTSAATSSSSFPSDDLELLSIKSSASHSYTSIKDLLPSVAVNSPKPNSPHPVHLGSDISIRNRLVKQAAWAYLQPMSTSPDSAAGDFFHRLRRRVAAFFGFVRRSVVRVIDWTLRVIRFRSSR
ncbi:hypothetical protein BUALT_Bualt11G0090600 [Buddleja alternifolia]|uniref:Uncharacterized protein n=1 Tax=Buddleja alternifolia TaxID=168488 RepID=A0AAV6X4B3_9LAMI|nr:hypothetical protein BUALT_Bualt11G0090600 [Buddleja alternifolia]